MLLQENCGKVNHKLIKKKFHFLIVTYVQIKCYVGFDIFIKIFIREKWFLCWYFHMTELDILPKMIF